MSVRIIFAHPLFPHFPATVWPRCAAAHGDRWPHWRRPAAPPPKEQPRLPKLPIQPRQQSCPRQSGRLEHVLRGWGGSCIVNTERPPRELYRGASEAIMAFVEDSRDGLLHFAVVSRHCSHHRLGLSQRRRAPAHCKVWRIFHLFNFSTMDAFKKIFLLVYMVGWLCHSLLRAIHKGYPNFWTLL